MKKPVIVWPFLSLLAFMLVTFGFSLPQHRQQAGPSANNGIAVVELFTSEGCSSCPPADEAVTALSHDYPATVFVLGFHVDYWNYLGWKDVFSDAAYSKRQEAYAGAFALSSIYTPQVVVNGRYQFTGSDKIRLYNTVEKELVKDLPGRVGLTAKTNGRSIRVDYTATAAEKSWLYFALVQRTASSAVQRGENSGKQLHHIDVVRDFVSSAPGSGFVNLHLPAGCRASDFRIIGFVQRKEDLHITGAAACLIQ